MGEGASFRATGDGYVPDAAQRLCAQARSALFDRDAERRRVARRPRGAGSNRRDRKGRSALWRRSGGGAQQAGRREMVAGAFAQGAKGRPQGARSRIPERPDQDRGGHQAYPGRGLRALLRAAPVGLSQSARGSDRTRAPFRATLPLRRTAYIAPRGSSLIGIGGRGMSAVAGRCSVVGRCSVAGRSLPEENQDGTSLSLANSGRSSSVAFAAGAASAAATGGGGAGCGSVTRGLASTTGDCSGFCGRRGCAACTGFAGFGAGAAAGAGAATGAGGAGGDAAGLSGVFAGSSFGG